MNTQVSKWLIPVTMLVSRVLFFYGLEIKKAEASLGIQSAREESISSDGFEQ